MNKAKLTCVYLFFDLLAALVTWVGLYVYRKHVGESADFATILTAMRADSKFWLGLALYPPTGSFSTPFSVIITRFTANRDLMSW